MGACYKCFSKIEENSEITNRYKRIKARRAPKKTIIAICRILLTAIWLILTDLEPYKTDGCLDQRPVKESKVINTTQALNILRQRGYVISDAEKVMY